MGKSKDRRAVPDTKMATVSPIAPAAVAGYGRPTGVLINNRTYRIEWLSEDQWVLANESDGDAGVCRVIQCSIRLRVHEYTNEQVLRENLFHEILHAVWDIVALNSDDIPVTDTDREEYTIRLITPQVLFVLQQNESVTRYLLERD